MTHQNNYTTACIPLLLPVLALLFFAGCKVIPLQREVKKVQEISSINPSNKFIKTHMKDGQVYILYNWRFDSAAYALTGLGSLLDINRKVIESRGDPNQAKKNAGATPFTIPLSDVALLETNDPGPSLGGGLGIVTGITAGFTIYCLSNPKACFGSCPTFYASNGDTLTLQAEGFSASIAPSLEKADIDMLYAARPSPDFELLVTNEALETHAIRYANLLAVEKKANERVFADPGGVFYKCTNIAPPTRCQSPGGDCLASVSRVDGTEYYSLADSADLNTKEDIYVSFPASDDQPLGLVIGKRQTLLTTYLMYQGLAYMGHTATYWLAEQERGKIAGRTTLFDLLGSIEVFQKDARGNWVGQGKVHETGPIASDFNIIPLSLETRGPVELKLRLNKGLWRIDYLALATITGVVTPTVIQPYTVEVVKGSEAAPLQKLLNNNEYLLTYPGDAYRIKYKVPFTSAELFLNSRGYYLEWMRTEWIKEQNLRKLNVLVNRPARYLKKAARPYKKLEPLMEKTFWESRYEQK